MIVRQTMVQGYEEGSTLTVDQWHQTIADFNGLCAYCQERPNEQLEHFIPRSKGGKTHVGNCLPACVICNKKKNNHTGTFFIAMFGEERIEYLKQYLASRSQEPIVEPEQQPQMKVRLRIKELAQERRMLQKDVAAKSGVTLQLLNRYWHNHIQSVNLEQLGSIAKALGVNVGDLLESTEDISEEIRPAA